MQRALVIGSVLALLAAAPVQAAFRLRAREHFEWSTLRSAGAASGSYFGLSGNVNAWWEEPWRQAFGFTIAFGSPRARSSQPAGAPEKLSLRRLGLEYKRFLWRGLFGRVGAGVAWLDTKGGAGTLFGGGPYLGLGWEFPVWKLGLAPELGVQKLRFEGGARYAAFTPSLGVHFYVFSGDQKR